MKVSWLVGTLFLLLAVGLAGNTFAGRMTVDTPLQQSTVFAGQASLPVQAGMANGANCCVGSPVCVAGNGASGACGAGPALLPETSWTLAGPFAASADLPDTAALMTPQTLVPLIRPSRA